MVVLAEEHYIIYQETMDLKEGTHLSFWQSFLICTKDVISDVSFSGSLILLYNMNVLPEYLVNIPVGFPCRAFFGGVESGLAVHIRL